MSATKKTLMEGFNRLFDYFGPLEWWPGDTPFEIMVGAILTQNANWRNAELAVRNLKQAGVLSPKDMLALHPLRLQNLIRPAGFFRVKAKRLIAFLKYFVGEYGGSAARMAKEDLEKLRPELKAINGIGSETADSMLLYALNKPIFVIDAYTKRILSRHALCTEEDGYDELQELFMDRLPHDVVLFNEYHALIVEVGKTHCRPTNPKCDGCPLNGWNL
ncbi:MAG: endonuclease III domain-containing protein [Pseudomonadota bacterium]